MMQEGWLAAFPVSGCLFLFGGFASCFNTEGPFPPFWSLPSRQARVSIWILCTMCAVYITGCALCTYMYCCYEVLLLCAMVVEPAEGYVFSCD